MSENDKNDPYPLSWEEQDRLFTELPPHLKRMALFKVNTGCRAKEVCRLRWEWEIAIPELKTSVFVIPKHSLVNGQLRSNVKNAEHRLVILNNIAKKVIDEVRHYHPTFVFTFNRNGKKCPITSNMHNSGWRNARIRAGLPHVRIHDLKHTFDRRLRNAGVNFEGHQDLLGHKSDRITTHYSPAEIQHLINEANKVCERNKNSLTLTMLRCARQTPTISPPGRYGNLAVVK